MLSPWVRVIFVLINLAVGMAGVQIGFCYCNVGVCYKTVDGETVLCKTDADFYGEDGEKDGKGGMKIDGL